MRSNIAPLPAEPLALLILWLTCNPPLNRKTQVFRPHNFPKIRTDDVDFKASVSKPISNFLGVAALTVAMAAPASAEGVRFDFSVGGMTEDYIGRAESNGRLTYDGIALSAAMDHGRLSASVTVAEAFNGNDTTVPLYDLSFGLGDGNWRVGLGKVERNWGPSERTSLILSKNAPAFHSAYIKKSEATVTDFPVIRWLGAWDAEFFVGTTEDTTQPDDALIMGMRVSVEPIRNFEIELVRTAQWGGAGQPSGWGTFVDILTGQTNSGVSSGANQMAGFSLAYSMPRIADGSRIFVQAIGEDESNGRPSCFMYMGGVEVKTPLFGIPSEIALEHVDTRIDRSPAGFCGPNTAYNNNTYRYLNRGVSMGAAIDSEGYATSVNVVHHLEDMQVEWGLGHYTINDASSATHRLSSTRQQGVMVSAGISKEALGGTLQALVVHQGFDLDTAGTSKGARFGVNFTKSF
jgi:hypothetical protein